MIPTIKVYDTRFNGELVIINESDFDPTIHRHEVDGPGEPIGASEEWANFPGAKALQEAGIKSVAELKGKSPDELKTIRGIGEATAKQIFDKLAELES